jgi:dihydropteroate synthase
MKFASRELDLSSPVVMGVLNVTPDSFSDGGRFQSLDNAINQAQLMVDQGAQIIDVGGESTRPGATPVSLQEELDRVLPVVEALSSTVDVVISVDSSSPEVIQQTADAGAGLINDVRALQRPGALEVAAKTGLPVCLMHMQGSPETMQLNPCYENAISDISAFFSERVSACEKAGISRDRIILDPGFGFGKTLEHNLLILKHLGDFGLDDFPVLAGLSRKSMLGLITGKDVSERVSASVAAALMAMSAGASIVRVHDVDETIDAIKVWSAVRDI